MILIKILSIFMIGITLSFITLFFYTIGKILKSANDAIPDADGAMKEENDSNRKGKKVQYKKKLVWGTFCVIAIPAILLSVIYFSNNHKLALHKTEKQKSYGMSSEESNTAESEKEILSKKVQNEGINSGDNNGNSQDAMNTNENDSISEKMNELFRTKPVENKINIAITPTSYGTNTCYYCPVKQEELDVAGNIFSKITWKEISKFPKNTYRIGVALIKNQETVEFLQDGSFYYTKKLGDEEKSYLGSNPVFYKEVLDILKNDFDFIPFDPNQLSTMSGASANYQRASEDVFTQTLSDTEDITALKELLCQAKPVGGITACPFGEAKLIVKKADGSEQEILLASDGCGIYLANGICFEYDQNNRRITQLFDLLPWRENENK